MIPKMPIKIGLKIEDHSDIHAVWNHHEARILALLWAPCHLINEYFWQETLDIGKRIEEQKPMNAEELKQCFGWEFERGHETNFSALNIDRFVTDALPYFLGENQVEYEFCT